MLYVLYSENNDLTAAALRMEKNIAHSAWKISADVAPKILRTIDNGMSHLFCGTKSISLSPSF